MADRAPVSAELSRELSLFHITMMGLGMMIGAGVFIGIGISIREAGPGGVILTFALNGLIALFTAMSFAELSSAVAGLHRVPWQRRRLPRPGDARPCQSIPDAPKARPLLATGRERSRSCVTCPFGRRGPGGPKTKVGAGWGAGTMQAESPGGAAGQGQPGNPGQHDALPARGVSSCVQ